jgi:ribosomal-protein-alanine N-acetyltransferase
MAMTTAYTFELETPRLRLRPLTMDDLEDLYALYRDPEVRRYFPDGTRTYAETQEELAWFIDVYYARYGYGLWATHYKPTGEFIGRCGLIPWSIEGEHAVEVAYLLAKPFWGQGLATEVAGAILNYAFMQLRLPRVICMVDPEHLASARVAEKNGMVVEREGMIEGAMTRLYTLAAPWA